MVPFHLGTIAKPQDIYGIAPDNSNTPFVHAKVPSGFTNLTAKDFVDRVDTVQNLVALKPKSLEATPFTYIDTVEGLKSLRLKLSQVNEFAVDLEANMYRSFQGLTCLMQISTRTEDFVVDTLQVHNSVGKYLGSLFLDPSKRKVMHGAGNDILWLQRDFGIYVCNLFDTMQASKILKHERNSLEHLLLYYCGVPANKQYQTSDWRIRPLPHEMLYYAREDTHYLLYIYDSMRKRLLTPTTEIGNPLLELYKRAQKICTTLYEKELFSENSYTSIYKFNEAGLSVEQEKVAARLYEWRDYIARTMDESTGYVMPNKMLLEISQKTPETKKQLMSIITEHNYPNHPFVLENIDELMRIICESDMTSTQVQPPRLNQNQGYDIPSPLVPNGYYYVQPCQATIYVPTPMYFSYPYYCNTYSVY